MVHKIKLELKEVLGVEGEEEIAEQSEHSLQSSDSEDLIYVEHENVDVVL